MSLYPEITPFNQFHLPVGDGHRLYVEESGNPAGVPVLVVHGGPGGGSSPRLRRFFDPRFWRVILFDQRGAGASLPAAGTDANTTAHLVADMELIRAHLGIDRWLLFGGSWGATLALCYAQAHRQQVLGLVLRGVFLCRPQDLDWLYGGQGAARLRPEAWQAFLAPLSATEREAPLSAYHARLHSGDAGRREQAALAWAAWEAACATLEANVAVERGFAARAMALARIETHFFVHDGFMERPLLAGMERLADVPGVIVHGRYDLVCPVEQAVSLHQRWPASRLQVVPGAGHSLAEPGIGTALVTAVSAMQERLAQEHAR